MSNFTEFKFNKFMISYISFAGFLIALTTDLPLNLEKLNQKRNLCLILIIPIIFYFFVVFLISLWNFACNFYKRKLKKRNN
jgi:hypothetical protein